MDFYSWTEVVGFFVVVNELKIKVKLDDSAPKVNSIFTAGYTFG